MSLSIPLRSRSSHPESSCSHAGIIAAVQDFYELLIKLPYIESDSLVFPPAEGWAGVDAEALLRRGKTEEVIELLRHLPYLRPPAPGKRWMVGPDTIEIAYCDGELYDEVLDSIQPVPGYCIWLTEVESRDGTGLLLDTQTGTITEWTTMEHKLMIDYDEYENLPTQDKWMAHATMPASAFFRLWKRKFEKMVWMALYDPKGKAGTAQWYVSATTPHEEEDMLASDDDFEPDADEHGGIEEDGSESDGDNDMSDGDGQISSEEVNDLMEDAYGEEAHKRQMQLRSEESTAGYPLVNMPASEPADRRQPLLGSLDRKTKEVYGIYTRNGWPSSFDREKCRMCLAEFLEREEGPIHQM